MNTVSNGGNLTAEMQQKDGRSPSFAAPEYYYSSDLKVIEGKTNLPPTEKAEPSQDYYYSDSLPVPGNPPVKGPTPTAADLQNSADPGAAYYSDGFTPKLPGVDSIPRGKPNGGKAVGAGSLSNNPTSAPNLPGVNTIPRGKPVVEANVTKTDPSPEYYSDAFTPFLPDVGKIPLKKTAKASTPLPPAVHSIPGYAKVDKPPSQMYQNFGNTGKSSQGNFCFQKNSFLLLYSLYFLAF